MPKVSNQTPGPRESVWSRAARLIERHPEVKQLRLNADGHKLTIGFHKLPADEELKKIELAARAELSGNWDVSVEPDSGSPTLHLHKIDNHTTEVHRPHVAHEPPVIWKRIALPAWRNRPYPSAVSRDYRVMFLLAAICGGSTLLGFLLGRAPFNQVFVTPFFAIAYLTGGWFVTQDVWRGLKQRKVDIHFLMIAVALGALVVNAATEGGTLLFLFSLSNALEQFANYRTRKSIESLLKVAPKLAFRREHNCWVEVAVEEIEVDDELLVKPGELFPVDGVVVEGATSADESALTGESIPVVKQIGDVVSGGTLNLDGQCVIRASRVLEKSALNQIVELIETAQQQKAPTQRFTDTFSRYYTWFALSLAAVVFITLLAFDRSFSEAFYRSMTVLVVASPCALVLSVPSSILVAIAAAGRRGILFRGGVAVENLARATDFVFDKTGTLTKGALVVARIVRFHRNEEDLLRVAASVAQFSTHPLARAIVGEAERRALSIFSAGDFLNVAGLGMEATLNGRRIFLGSRRFIRDRGVHCPAVGSTNDAEVWVAENETVLGVIYLRDEVRPAAKRVIDFLKRSGVMTMLLTGDRAGPATIVAGQVGISDVKAELSPQAKLEFIHALRIAGRKVAMVGDGINDAPSLAAADVSIGMGARGSDAALEQADVILMHDRIENLEDALRLSRRARRVIGENVVISLSVIILLLTSALMEKIDLTFGVIGHEGSTVFVILNALRLLRPPRAE